MVFNRCLPPKKKLNIFLDYSKEKDIVTYGVVQKVKKIGEGDFDYIIVDELIETSRVNRQEELNRYRDDYDIYTVLGKVAETGDLSLMHSRGEMPYFDATKLPQTTLELETMLASANKAWEALPADLKGKMSLAEFVDSFKDEDLTAYFNAKQTVKQETQTGGTKDE